MKVVEIAVILSWKFYFTFFKDFINDKVDSSFYLIYASLNTFNKISVVSGRN